MEEEEEPRKGGSETSDATLLAQLVFVKMDEVVDYLKILDYEKEFCKKLKFKPFSRYRWVGKYSGITDVSRTGTTLPCQPTPGSSSLLLLIWLCGCWDSVGRNWTNPRR